MAGVLRSLGFILDGWDILMTSQCKDEDGKGAEGADSQGSDQGESWKRILLPKVKKRMMDKVAM